MDPITQQTLLAAAAAADKDPVYVDDVFSTFLYVGNGATGRNIVNGIDLSGEGGLTWVKKRSSGSEDHVLLDTERGANKFIRCNSEGVEITSGGPITAFRSDGFTVDNNGYVNSGNLKYASWTFRKQKGFFDVVTWTGNSTAGRTISHNLGSVPGFIIVKALNVDRQWHCYHRSLGNTKTIVLSQNNGATTSGSHWNNTTPTSSVFTLGNDADVNQSTTNYVAYLFAHDNTSFGTDRDQSIIKCGSYTGNGSTDGPEINLGFEAQWILLKRADSGANWYMFDIMRGMSVDGDQAYFEADSTSYEVEGRFHDITSTGWKTVKNWGLTNASGGQYIYIAIRRSNKPPELATEVFAVDTKGGTNPIPPTFSSGFPVDWSLYRPVNENNSYFLGSSRLMGNQYLNTATNAAKNGYGTSMLTYDRNDGMGTDSSSDSLDLNWMFKRAPGFFDVVAYDGKGSVATYNHNLGVVPELMIVKSRSHSENWRVYAASLGATKALQLNSVSEASTSSTFWNNTAPTSSVFTVTSYDGVGNSGKTYMNYMFATLDGISKVGSYTGTGNAINVDCGFTNGARFILIKCTDYVFNPSIPFGWFVYDSVRGINSGNDPYIHLDSSSAQVTNTDYVDPLAAGFTVTSSAPPALNSSGKNYIFLAIA